MWAWVVPLIKLLVGLLPYFFGLTVAKNKEQDKKIEELQDDLETLKRLRDVQINTDRDAALKRLQSTGNLRDD